MNLNKLRIMQMIQIALFEKGLNVSVESSSELLHICVQEYKSGAVLEWIYGFQITEAELQLWHDTIVYGPQVSNED